MENLSALEPRHTVLCPEHMLFDMQNGTWFVETIRASGQVIRANRPDTRPHLTNINHIRNVLLSRSHPHRTKQPFDGLRGMAAYWPCSSKIIIIVSPARYAAQVLGASQPDPAEQHHERQHANELADNISNEIDPEYRNNIFWDYKSGIIDGLTD